MVTLGIAAVAAGCTAPAGSDASVGPASGSGSPSGSLASGGVPSGSVRVARLPQAVPVDRESAAIAAAFDPAAAAALAADLPTDLDWSTTGLLCVYLGRRSEGGWGLAIQGASLVDGELRVLARETRPSAGVDRPGPTYPADCATISRDGLPVGMLPAQAHDTVSDEFIVAGELVVPSR